MKVSLSSPSPTRIILQSLKDSSALIPVPGLGPAVGAVIAILDIVEVRYYSY